MISKYKALLYYGYNGNSHTAFSFKRLVYSLFVNFKWISLTNNNDIEYNIKIKT